MKTSRDEGLVLFFLIPGSCHFSTKARFASLIVTVGNIDSELFQSGKGHKSEETAAQFEVNIKQLSLNSFVSLHSGPVVSNIWHADFHFEHFSPNAQNHRGCSSADPSFHQGIETKQASSFLSKCVFPRVKMLPLLAL